MLDDSGNKITSPTSVTKKWLLESELYVTDGAIFYCIGSEEGGDCDELRIQSTGPDDWYEVRGHGGSMYFSHTVVTSWDTPNKKPQETYEGGRSFLNCVSEKLTGETCDGKAKNDEGECRMDIINSEMGYMGFFDAESYGLTWKVRGFCKDLSNPDVFETTNVYGDIKNSNIHHMYYGMYSYGHQGGVWTNNEMHDNHQYGFDPHDDSDYLTIANNKVYNNHNHGIIASKRCNNVQIYNNEVSDGGPEAVGIFLHRSSDNAEVYGGLYTYRGSDAPDVSNGRPNGNTFNNNKITNTAGGVKIKNSDNIVISNNDFTGTEELEFFDAQATTWSDNSLPSGVCIDNVTSDDGNSVPPSTFSSSSGVPSEEC
ncbi:Mannuronan C-5-epimerase [Ectocarpus siliculosus]|uniref:Mannuronan C-5-epimerase n=1 Tax=Ectocarpus siliculosus TaxID=2880 RepID=D7FIU4_ECTSI|nr:Mannuronan C-5-epimerase [Ectocarpus siliculosus]|eukprot:CBJ28911.1 Mannuronan C-5-epimerase [Ectocarpus siliculosus]